MRNVNQRKGDYSRSRVLQEGRADERKKRKGSAGEAWF